MKQRNYQVLKTDEKGNRVYPKNDPVRIIWFISLIALSSVGLYYM